jgi:PKD repeat protein
MRSIATHPRRSAPAAVAALVVCAIALPAVASADTFCVHNPSGCVGSAQPDLKTALSVAGSNGAGKDTIKIGAGSFTEGPAVAAVGNPVDIVGASASDTTLLGAGNGITVLRVLDPASSVSDLGVRITGTGGETGIELAGHGSHLKVTNNGAQAGSTGVELSGAFPTLEASSVALSYGPNDIAVRAVYAFATHATITDSSLTAMRGVYASGGQVDLMRSRVWAQQGVTADSAGPGAVYATASDTSFRAPGPSPSNYDHVALAAGGSGWNIIDADRITAYGGGGGGGVAVRATPAAAAGNKATVNLRGSVIDGFATAVFANQDLGATATVTTASSAYKLGSAIVKGGATYSAAAGNLDLTGIGPGFVDAAGGDLRLRHDSPLVDRGDPAFQPAGALDRDGLPRLRDGDGASGPRVDIGAFEYQRYAPVASATATPSTVEVGQTVTFGGKADDADPGETSTYQWAFDDGATATGASAPHAFASAGAHAATLTVTDPSGLSDTVQATVTVNAPAAAADGTDSTATGTESAATVRAVQAPSLTGLRLAPTTFRPRGTRPASVAHQRAPIGTAITYALSRPAAVTFTVKRASAGRRVGTACARPTRANRSHRSCTGWVTVGAFTRAGAAGSTRVRFDGRLGGRALRTGRYRLSARAVDRSGMRSATLTTGFRVV